MREFLLSSFANDYFWKLPAAFLTVVLIWALVIYYRGQNRENYRSKRLKKLIWITTGARLCYSALLTAFQYFVWSQSAVTKVFLSAPVDPASFPNLRFFSRILGGKLGYFYFYSFERFWLGAIISLFVAYLFYLFLKFLKRHKERFFEDGEIQLGFLLSLIVGWPNFVMFLMLIFVFVILVSIFRMTFLKESLTTLGYPMLLSAVVALVWGGQLLDILNWGVLRI